VDIYLLNHKLLWCNNSL